MTHDTKPPFQNNTRSGYVQAGDWPTVLLWVGCYVVWAVALFVVAPWSVGPAAVVVTLTLVLQSSLSHEILHGHPFTRTNLNTALGLLAIGLFIPYIRFRDTHLAHHVDERLTDPYDDPETNFQDPKVWARYPVWWQAVLRFNNTMLGRMTVGPVIGQWAFMASDARAIAKGDWQVARGWLLHIPAVVATGVIVFWSAMPLWIYVLAAVGALSILKIRTFLEHRAEEDPTARTVIVEDRGILAFLFLNNSLHVVHHMHPKVAWHALPALYRGNKDTYQTCNQGYVYASYAEVFRRYFWKTKDPVPHPRWPS